MTRPRTLFDKVWDAHLVRPEAPDAPAALYIDLHLIHEVTSPQAFAMLKERGLPVRRPDLTYATIDHSSPTLPAGPGGRLPFVNAAAERQVDTLRANCAEFGVALEDFESEQRGIVHVMGPELGLTMPGMTVVCGDSHTATHGAFGALAFGIGTTEVGHVLATQCLLQRKPKTMAVTVDGPIPAGVSAKDVILAVLAKITMAGGTGHVIEYRGEAIGSLSMEGRMTVANMSIEGGARAGMIAPDETTLAWLKGRRHTPKGGAFNAAAAGWLAMQSDPGAAYDKEVSLDARALSPHVTWGANPGQGGPIDAPIPLDADRRALDYMRFEAGKPILGAKVDRVFIGSCTNARLSDLEEAARLFEGRKTAEGVRVLVVPGSGVVKRQAEERGLHTIFLAAGAEWREPGCSMCIAMNGDKAEAGELVVSTSNRNFEGRQGAGARTVLASPATAAAAAVTGVITDPRELAS